LINILETSVNQQLKHVNDREDK